MNYRIIKRIMSMCILYVFIIFPFYVDAKYNYNYTLKAFSLTRKVVKKYKKMNNDSITEKIKEVENEKDAIIQHNNNDINYVIIQYKEHEPENQEQNSDSNFLSQNGEYKIKVTDQSGNICEKNIIINK